eukprot:1028084-Pelagomonas_calceolata.AAC.4
MTICRSDVPPRPAGRLRDKTRKTAKEMKLILGKCPVISLHGGRTPPRGLQKGSHYRQHKFYLCYHKN